MDFGLLFRNRMISVTFELEQAEFGILIPGIPLPEKSQKECDLRNKSIRNKENPAKSLAQQETHLTIPLKEV